MQEYIGRFAPSPTGKLHIGSLLCAVASFIDAKSMNGKWLVRIEDLDLPRTVDGASDDILYTLEAFNLYWDDYVIYQSQRHHLYQEALDNLCNQNLIYPCFCSRKEIKEQGRVGLDGVVYHGKCRDKSYVKLQKTPSYRIKTNNTKIEFNDLIVGKYSQNLAYDIGDFVLLRSDNQWAYQLAVIVDDSLQKITRIVRGQDLLVSTPRQIYLLECLGFKIPEYAHLPLLLNAQGQKLSKQTLAPALDIKQKIQLLKQVLIYLNLPNDMPDGDCEDLLSWAVEHWDISRVPKEGIKVFQAT